MFPSLSCFPCICVCVCSHVFVYNVLTVCRSVPPSSTGPRYGCSCLCWPGGGPAALCDTGVVRGSAGVPPQMPPSPRRHHRLVICSHRRLPPWQLQTSQTRYAHTLTHTYVPSHTHLLLRIQRRFVIVFISQILLCFQSSS